MLRNLLVAFSLIFISAPVLLFANYAYAQDRAAFETPAPHAIIMDYDTGLVLYEKKARTPIAPASMTKIMTAEMIFARLKDGRLTLDTEFEVSENAWRRGGAASGSSTMFLDPKSKVRVEDLLRGVIIQSGNDACIALAEAIAGSEDSFAVQMTERAQALGLTSATFKNATGWPHPDHRISLYDLGRLAVMSKQAYPEYYSIYSEPDFTWNNIRQPNRNPLLASFDGTDGLKTGHTESSGYGLVASAEREGQRRIIVVNGLESKTQRRNESLRLMRAAFDDFKLYELFKPEAVVGTVPVYMGRQNMVAVASETSVFSGSHKRDRANLKTQLRYTGHAVAPIVRGDHIADLIIQEPGRRERTIPLLATESVSEKSAFGKAMTVLVAMIRGA